MMDPVSPSKRRDRTRDNRARAVFRMLRRCDQLNRRYSADVYVLVRWKNRHYEYCSADDAAFPISPRDPVNRLSTYLATESQLYQGQGLSACMLLPRFEYAIREHLS